jgi:hypothetical protein
MMMITKEKLLNSYIENDNGELKALYIAALSSEGVYPCGHFNENHAHLECADACSGVAIYGVINADYVSEGSVKLTLADFKNTKVEYEKCEFDHAWEAVKAFECDNAEFHQKIPCGYKKIMSRECVFNRYSTGDLYRRVETEVTWLDELQRDYNIEVSGNVVELKGRMDKQVFIEMCSFVHNANNT